MNSLKILFKEDNEKKSSRNLEALFNLLADLGYKWANGLEINKTEIYCDENLYTSTLYNYKTICICKNKGILRSTCTYKKYDIDMKSCSIKEIKERILEFEKKMNKKNN